MTIKKKKFEKANLYAKKPLSVKIFVLTFFLLVSFLFLSILSSSFSKLSGFLYQNILLLLFLLFLQLIYVFSRALCLNLSLENQGIKYSFKESLVLFFTSIFVEIISFPSKIGSDLFKYKMVKADKKKVFKSILIFRVGMAIPFVIVFFCYIIFLKWQLFIVLIFLVFLMYVIKPFRKIFLGWLNSKKLKRLKTAFKKKNIKTFFFISILTAFSLVVEFFKMMLILSVFGFKFNISFFFVFLLSMALGGISNIPFGLGVKDASLGAYLTKFISFNEFLLFAVIIRFVGEIFTALIGWLLLSKEMIKLFRDKKELF